MGTDGIWFTLGMDLLKSLKHTENCYDGNFYIIYILPQLKKIWGVGKSQGVEEGQGHRWEQKPTLYTLAKKGAEEA